LGATVAPPGDELALACPSDDALAALLLLSA
jgi:hypothetical protein